MSRSRRNPDRCSKRGLRGKYPNGCKLRDLRVPVRDLRRPQFYDEDSRPLAPPRT